MSEMEQTFGFSEGELRDVGFGGEVEDFALHGEGFDEYQRLLGELLEDEDFSKTLLRLEIRRYRLGLEQYKHSYSPQANAWETLRSWPYPLPDGQALQKTLQDRGGGAFHITFFHDETPHFQCVVQLEETETMQPPRREEHRSDFAEIALKGDGVIGKLTDKALNSGDAVIGMLNNNVRDLRDTIERMSKDHRDQLETMRRDHKEEREKLEAKLEAIKSQPPAKDDDFFKEMFRQKFMSPSPDEGKHPPCRCDESPLCSGH